MKTDKIAIAHPEMTEEMIEAASAALRNERLVMGESVFKFEEEFAKYCGVKHAISVSSGTDALSLAMIALDLKGKEVLTTPLSFIATANTVVHAGGKPVFCDADPVDNNIDIKAAAKVKGKKIKAILPVHLFGHPCDMDAMMDLAQERDWFVIEDACQAHGAEFKGKKVGDIGTVGCFSFYPTKNMTVGGDGGMVTTNDEKLAKDVAKLRDCGRVSRYLHDVVGYTSRLNTCNAAIGRIQLRHLDQWNDRRREIAKLYTKLLKGTDGVMVPPSPDKKKTPVYHLYAIKVKGRDQLAAKLSEAGIDTAVHYPVPIHLQPAYKDVRGFKEGDYPVAERSSSTLMSLPIYPSLTNDQVKRVAETIKKLVK
ncbi:MAG: TDP-4-oxo-6-deoxy-D-glucose transaminase [Methanomassiliicoccales archaeon PtaU1.Bin124]|nr:MAG: TDP-4-oxo-6-deoxy-D-glucose transaminase [Methanomassiliicoccales archaeon PtaU1.Bin124]